MRDKVLAFWRAQALPEDTAVTCAVSGGADSVAMLHCLLSLQEELGITVCAAHYNHHLRGTESDRDEAFVRELCQTLGVPLTVSGGDVAARAGKTGESVEEAARRMRYDFFETLDSFVATAHTADDNLETVLLNLVRGTSLRGLCGIPVRRGNYLRPLLPCTRQDVLDYLTLNDLSHVEDSTNAQPDCVRNRLRQQVVPLLRRENPRLAEHTLAMTQRLRADEDALEALVRQALDEARDAGGWRCSALAALPDALRSRAVRAILQTMHIPRLTERHIAAVLRLITSPDPAARCDLPGGVTARREYDRLLLGAAEVSAPVWHAVPLKIGQWTRLPQLALRVFAGSDQAARPDGKTVFALRRADVDTDTLCVRPRKAGDALRLPGGRKTLKRLFIDRKLPRAQRDLVPVIADRFGVLAVCGVGAAYDRMAGITDDALIIKIEKEDTNGYD